MKQNGTQFPGLESSSKSIGIYCIDTEADHVEISLKCTSRDFFQGVLLFLPSLGQLTFQYKLCFYLFGDTFFKLGLFCFVF